METISKGRLHRIGIQNENPLTIHRSYGFIAVVAAVIIYLFLQILRMYVLARSASMLVTEGTPLAVGSRETVGFMTFLTIARAAGFFGVLAIIVLSLVPGTYRPHTGLPGVAEHFITYCSTAFAFALGFRSSASRVVIALVLTLLAGSMEVLQLWVPGRHSAISDAVFSSLGGLLGIALGGLLLVLTIQAYKKHRHLVESAELVQ